MLTRSLKVGLWVALISLSALAKPSPRMVQSRYNAQLQVQNMGTVSSSLDQLCRECQAQITNLNCDMNSANGNLNVRVPEEKLTRFCEGLRALGQVRSENRSTSDNTSSYLEAQRNLEIAEKTLSAQWAVSGSTLSATDKGLVDAEFKTFLRERINSYRNNISSYEQNQGFAEVSVNLSGLQIPPEQSRHSANRPAQVEVTQVEMLSDRPPAVPQPAGISLALAATALLMLGLIAFFVRKQMVSRVPAQSDERKPEGN